ncbi:MAG: HAD family hydrolase [Muribaculaceae bacterium]|nr:HAD family hydrolase [Muribaculaceae bacterium]
MTEKFKDIKGVIFDYGGTIDSGGDHWSEVIWEAWQKADVLVDKGLFRDCYVYAERELARVLHILPHHNFGDLLNIKMNIELQKLSETGNFPPEQIESKSKEIAGYCYAAAKKATEDAKETLDYLAGKYPLVLVSNFYGNINTVLEDFGLKKYFPTVIESAVVGVRKPDPEIFRLGVESMKLKPEEVVVIGDSYSKDIEPALSLGCRAVWIKGKQWSSEEAEREYPATIGTLSELQGLL